MVSDKKYVNSTYLFSALLSFPQTENSKGVIMKLWNIIGNRRFETSYAEFNLLVRISVLICVSMNYSYRESNIAKLQKCNFFLWLIEFRSKNRNKIYSNLKIFESTTSMYECSTCILFIKHRKISDRDWKIWNCRI